MGRPKSSDLPQHLSFHSPNQTYYYKNPAMSRKANLGKDAVQAIRAARSLNQQHAIETERAAQRLLASVNCNGSDFGPAFVKFVDKYSRDYRLKASTQARLMQRSARLTARLGDLQIPMISTEILREAIENDSSFEQVKIRTILQRFFQFAKSCGQYPQHLPNPVDDLYVDPSPAKRRQRMTLQQFRAIHDSAPEWLQIMMTLGLHLALRRIDLVNLRFGDIQGDRIVSPIRNTDSKARSIEATSVSFPIHPEVRRAIASARTSSIRNGRCPFIVHRSPQRRTQRQKDAIQGGRMAHPAQVLPEYASKAFARARHEAMLRTRHFVGIHAEELPTLHEIRSLSSHLYARSGYETRAVQDLMAHTDPDMTRAYQRGHARKVLQVEMLLPARTIAAGDDFSECGNGPRIREQSTPYLCNPEKKFSQNFLTQLSANS